PEGGFPPEGGAGEPAAREPAGEPAAGVAAEAAAEAVFEGEGQPDPYERIAELELALAQAGDALLRKAADFENFRKRMNADKQSAIDFANQSLLLDIISVIDDFERAIAAAQSSQDFSVLLDGVKMTEKQLVGMLENKWGLKRSDDAGAPFDPNIHEALMMEKSPDATEALVTDVLVKGYWLKNRLIRAAKVKVIMPENPPQEAGEEGAASFGQGS
ncbi:MAG: nucleotide exchange factor GrpE, partial [Spirochaetes bacterium]|nr:nucleotide exchange factor GrpE [Spirochaetota bacterium]